MSLVKPILRKATREPGEPINVLTFPTHERYQNGFADVNAVFYLWRTKDKSIKDWNPKYGELPKNHILLNPDLGDSQVPPWVDIDVVLSQNKFGQFPVAKNVSQFYHVPLISLEHTLPIPYWKEEEMSYLKTLRGNVNLFISDFSRRAWGWPEELSNIIEHGIDTNLFSPLTDDIREPVLLSVNNDWINREWCLNYSGWKRITRDLPVKVFGDTPGLSRAARDMNELVNAYRTSQIYLNTTTYSPIPTALLEAMSCGCAPIALANCMIPDVIENGVNGFTATSEDEIRYRCEYLLKNPDICRKLGQKARETILERFNMDQFVENWNIILFGTIGEKYES